MGIYSRELTQGNTWNLCTKVPQTMVLFNKIFGYTAKVGTTVKTEIHQFGSIDSQSLPVGAYFGQQASNGRIRVDAQDDTKVHMYVLAPPEECSVVFLSTASSGTFKIGRKGNYSVPASGAVVCFWHVNTGTRVYKINRKQMNIEDRIYLFTDNAQNKVTLLNETLVDFEGQIALFRMKMETIESGLEITIVPDTEREFPTLAAMFEPDERPMMILKGQRATTGKDRRKLIKKPTPTIDERDDAGFTSYKLTAGSLAMTIVLIILVIVFVILFAIWTYVTIKTRSLKASVLAKRNNKEKESKERLMSDIQRPNDVDDVYSATVFSESSGIPKVVQFDKV